MAGSLFITGATGFLGRHVLARLERAHWDDVICLARSDSGGRRNGARWLKGDLLDAATYADALGPETTVLHLAAVTGKADRGEYQRVNVEGTEVLLDASRKRGVRRFVLVSSVAARYRDLSSYPYGQSKRDAETRVAASGLAHLIVRPTIVLGHESPIWQKLRQLASAPVVPLIGNGRTRVQPIHAADVAAALTAVADNHGLQGALELAGPDVVSIADLLGLIRRQVKNSAVRLLPIPYKPLSAALGLLEKRWQRFLPVTAGQLSMFVNDSTVEPVSTLQAMWPHMMRIDEMIQASEYAHA